ncbi:hypothetical protein [Nocardia sp. NPDC050406]|uniref:hypothetical protein n=1 Tax=Nocardia sp. NPDC050406 TaxID=3364318 RepID=UPI0037B0B878
MGLFRRKKPQPHTRTPDNADFVGEATPAMLEAAPGLARVAFGWVGRLFSAIAHALN